MNRKLKEISLLTIAEGDNSYHHANSNPGSASAHRRRTDLMPTITFSTASPAGSAGAGGGTGNGYSRSSTPGNRMLRSPGKAVSMSRLDTLSKPRNSRLQIHQTSVLHASNSASANQTSTTPKNTRQGSNYKTNSPQSTTDSQKSNKNWSKSMTHLGPKKLSPILAASQNTKSKGK